MDTFFKFLKKGLVATVFVAFALVATYVPIPHQNNVHTAEAGWSNVATDYAIWALEEAQNYAIAAAETARHLAEKALDISLRSIAWWTAKLLLSQMLNQVTAWIQSGFKGRPMFVEDIGGFLKEVADEEFGRYIEKLGGPASFLCAPFRLDIQVALSLEFQRNLNEEEVTCTLTGIIDNIEGFMSGTQGSFSQGGWDDWFEITSAPGVYTPYGSAITASDDLGFRLANARGEILKEQDWGGGFLSTKQCKEVGAGTFQEKVCTIVAPGNVIVAQLNDHLGSERDSLVAADDINEVVGALFEQIAKKLFSGAHSLLDL